MLSFEESPLIAADKSSTAVVFLLKATSDLGLIRLNSLNFEHACASVRKSVPVLIERSLAPQGGRQTHFNT